MAVDAGTISSSVRLKLDQLQNDIKAAGTAFDNLGDEFTRSATNYSTIGGKKYKAALESIAKESKNVTDLVKQGALTQSQGIERLIKLRKEELKILQDKAVKEGTASNASVAAIKKVEAALTGLEEQQKLLGSTKDGSLIGTFQKMQAVMQGPVAAFNAVKSVMIGVYNTAVKLENAWASQEEALALLDSTLTATGAGAWTSKDQLTAFASELQSVTKYGDETITAMQNVLLGFKNIKGDNFYEASKQILNMATIMKMDLTSAAQAVGKALDDPIAGIDSLSRQGFRFSKEQKEMLKVMVETGDIASAQKIILDELATTYGGAAQAAALTSSALRVQLKNALGDVSEEAGRWLSETAAPIRAWLIEMATLTAKSAANLNDKSAATKALKEAEKAYSDGTATTAQKILYLDSATNKAYDNWNEGLLKVKSIQKQVTDGTLSQADADAILNGWLKKKNQENLKIAESLEKELKQVNSLSIAERKRIDDSIAATEAKDKADKATEAKYTSARELIVNLLKVEESEYSKLQKQVDELNAVKWSGSKNEEERLKAIALLKSQQVAILEKEAKIENDATAKRAESGDKQREDEKKRLEGLQSILDKVNQLGSEEISGSEKSRETALKEIEGSTLIGEQKQALIDKVNEYYDLLADDEAAKAFETNLTEVMTKATLLFSSAIESATSATTSFYDKEINDSKEATDKIKDNYKIQEDAIKESYKERINAAKEAGDEETANALEAQQLKDITFLETTTAAKIASQEQITAIKETEKAAVEASQATAKSLITIGTDITKFIASGYTDVSSLISASSELIKLAFEGDEEKAKEFTDRLTSITDLLSEDLQPLLGFVVELMGLALDILTPMLEIISPFLPLLTDILKVALIPITIQFQVLAEVLDYIADALKPVLDGMEKLGKISAPNLLKGTSVDDDVKKFIKFLGFERGGIVPSFDTGGIVPGTSRTGDNVPALVNSGEMILNNSQQSRLFDMLNGSASTTNNNSTSFNIGNFFGTESQMRELARRLVPMIEYENNRRGKK